MIRPLGWPDAVATVPAAAVLIAAGGISLDGARSAAQQLVPVTGFLAAVLVLARLCDDEGLFDACGGWMARAAAAAAAGRAVRGQVMTKVPVMPALAWYWHWKG